MMDLTTTQKKFQLTIHQDVMMLTAKDVPVIFVVNAKNLYVQNVWKIFIQKNNSFFFFILI